jgi:tetratricopeptide (TPR) repeat protein
MADSSHGLDAEIQKFEQKHGEHPEGRYFVPLANAYRKNGDLEHAEALLREGLKHHPDYLSAHIVLGRCLADRGAISEAEEQFRLVVAGDPQNLVALRALGELAASSGRRAEAVSWYEQLLAIDPMSSEAREGLEAVRSAPEQAPAVEESGHGSSSEHGDPFNAHDEPFAVHDDPFASQGDASSAEGDSGSASAAEGEESPAAGFEPLELDAGFDLSTPPAENAEVGSPEGFDPFSTGDTPDASAAWAPEPATEREPAAASRDDTLGDAPGEAEPAAETSQPFSGDDFSLDLPAFEQSDEGEEDEFSFDLSALPPSGDGGDAPGEVAEDAAGDEAAEEEAEVVTETIAELYAAQGFREKALGIYQELVRRRGEEPGLLRRIAELERPSAPPVFDEPEPSVETDHAAEEAVAEASSPARPEAAFSAPADGEEGSDPFADSFAQGFGGGGEGPTVAAFFRALLAWGSRRGEESTQPAGPVAEESQPDASPDFFAPDDASEVADDGVQGREEDHGAVDEGLPWEAEGESLPWEVGMPDGEEAPHEPAADAEATGSDFSYDRFFGDSAAADAQPAEPASELPHPEASGGAFPEDGTGSAADAEPSPTGSAEGEPDEGEAGDLESFQSWLRSLKR